MKFTIILNCEIPLKRAMNALSQMAFGWGHRLTGEPDLDIYFGNNNHVRAFRTRAALLATLKPDEVLASDFPHTMVGPSDNKLLSGVVNTPETEVIYFGACCVSKQLDLELTELLKSCYQLNGYTPHISNVPSQLLSAPAIEKQNFLVSIDAQKYIDAIIPKKIVMLLPNKVPLVELLNPAILSAIKLAHQVPHHEQYLLNIGNEEPGSYNLVNISYYSNVVVKAKPEDYSKITEQLAKQDSPRLFFQLTTTSKKAASATVVFGDLELVEETVAKNITRLFSDELAKGTLQPCKPNTNEETITTTTINNINPKLLPT